MTISRRSLFEALSATVLARGIGAEAPRCASCGAAQTPGVPCPYCGTAPIPAAQAEVDDDGGLWVTEGDIEVAVELEDQHVRVLTQPFHGRTGRAEFTWPGPGSVRVVGIAAAFMVLGHRLRVPLQSHVPARMEPGSTLTVMSNPKGWVSLAR